MKTYTIEYKIITAMQIDVQAESLSDAMKQAELDAGYGTDLYSYGAEFQVVDVREDADD